jgi:hypothetical protein
MQLVIKGFIDVFLDILVAFVSANDGYMDSCACVLVEGAGYKVLIHVLGDRQHITCMW